MVSWIYNTENNAKSVFMHFSEVMLHGLSLCVHCQIDHYREIPIFGAILFWDEAYREHNLIDHY
jgi:hypothetical protein